MKHAVWTDVALIVSFEGLAHSAEPSRAPQEASPAAPVAKASAADPDAVVPKREVKFVVSEDEAPLGFKAGVPGLLEQRLVVSFEVECEFAHREPVGRGTQLLVSASKEVTELLGNRSVRALTGHTPPRLIVNETRGENRLVLAALQRLDHFGH
jgi:hypothetical protein